MHASLEAAAELAKTTLCTGAKSNPGGWEPDKIVYHHTVWTIFKGAQPSAMGASYY